MKKALKQLLNSLDKLAEGDHDEVLDTDVREQMHDVVYKTLVEPVAGYELPEEFGMFFGRRECESQRDSGEVHRPSEVCRREEAADPKGEAQLVSE